MMMLKDWVWDKLFLDFYLDKRWTWRFKLMNLISGDALRDYLTATYQHLNSESRTDKERERHIEKAKYWTNCAWELWRNEL